MSGEQARSFAEQAAQAIQGGNPAGALEYADKALGLDANMVEAMGYRAVALSMLGRGPEATQAFRSAIAVAPGNAKLHYNYAVHLAGVGENAEARLAAARASELDPLNTAARDLADRMGGGTSGAPPMGAPQPQRQFPPGQFFREVERPGYAPMPAENIKFIKDLGRSWDVLGWLLVIGQLAFTIYSISVQLPGISRLIQAGGSQTEQQEAMRSMQHLLPPAAKYASYGVMGMLMLFGLLDVIHRKANMLWLLPIILCNCCGFGWVTMPFYLLLGRRTVR